MNILFLTPHFNITCGRSQHVLRLIKGLSKKGHNCILGTNDGTLLDELSNMDIAQVVILPINPEAKTIYTLLKSLYIISRTIRKHDINIVHSHHRWPEFIAFLASHLGNVHTVATAHSLRKGRKLLSHKSEKIIAGSKTMEEHLKKHFPATKDRIQTILQSPRSLSTPTQEEITSFKKECSIRQDELIVGAAGRFHNEKGFDILIDAAIKHANATPTIHWILAGSGPMEQMFVKKVQQEKLNFIILNDLTITELLYFVADIIAVPSREESTGLIPLEAAQFEKPVVASAVGGLRETIIDKERGLLVPPNDPDAMLAAILKLNRKPELAKKCARNLKEYVENNLSIETMISQTEQLYQTLS